MTRLSHRIAGTGLAAVTLALLVGCAGATGGAGAPALARDDPAPTSPESIEQPSADVPEECAEAFPLAFAPADIADIALQPADWPAPPDGATLCATAETLGGGTETASYAFDEPIEAALGHYESALTGYELHRADGAESGTGWATLDGTGSDVSFQVREADGGFVLVFGRGDQGG